MNRLQKCIIGGSFINLVAGAAWASGPGTTSADILKIGVGARAIGMGEAYVAQADDVSSLYWNPAGLAWMPERQASFMYSQLVQDMKYQHASLGIPLENGALAGSLSYLNYGSIPGYDTTGNALGDQSAYTGVGSLGAAWLGNQWSLGASMKGIQEKLADEKATGVAFDLGGDVIYPKPVLDGTLRFGVVVKNLGSGMEFLQQKDPFPTEWRIGMAAVQMMDKKLNVSLDYGKPRDDKGALYGGVEYWVAHYLALRTGYAGTKNEGSGIRMGIGFRIKGISFDYAYAGEGELGMTHRYELSFRFGEPRPILSAEEQKILRQAKAAMRQGRYEQATLLFDSLIEMEPRYKKAKRLIKVAMSHLETQQAEMIARQGKNYEPTAKATTKEPLSELSDLEQLLNLSSPKAAAAPTPKDNETGVNPQ